MNAATARQRVREQITREILQAARTRLSTQGPSELSLRAVARDIGMASSAVYRYFTSRDKLLTALLVVAYDELGAAAEQADAEVSDRSDTRQRWLVTCRAIRGWARGHPGDYALLYGSPVPGYAAPTETIEPATRVALTLAGIVRDAHAGGAQLANRPAGRPPPHDLVAGAMTVIAGDGQIDAEVVLRTIMSWTTLLGTISFEMFGHLVGSTEDYAGYFDAVATRLADDLGL